MTMPRLRVLIVEDDPADAKLIALELHRSGFDADCDRVDSVLALRAALAQPGWDLILTDHRMPALSVPAVLQQLKEHQVHAPCVLVSGTASEETARASIKLGMADFVSKNSLEELGPVVSRVLQDESVRQLHLRRPRLRLTGGHELRVVEWSGVRRSVDGETPLRPESDRKGLILDANEAIPVVVHVLGCQVHLLTATSVVYRSTLTLLG